MDKETIKDVAKGTLKTVGTVGVGIVMGTIGSLLCCTNELGKFAKISVCVATILIGDEIVNKAIFPSADKRVDDAFEVVDMVNDLIKLNSEESKDYKVG